MLNDLFQLNVPSVGGTIVAFNDEAALEGHFRISTNLKNVTYFPRNWPTSLSKVKDKSFENVGLSKTDFYKVTFVNCTFVDCLFIGSNFKEVQFHKCTFKNCNFYKASIDKCYWDPDSIHLDNKYKKTHANLGVQLFQQLMKNAQMEDQAAHVMNADIEFRKWKRAQLKHDKKEGHLTFSGYWAKFLGSLIYEIICGFGYKPLRFMICTIILFSFVSLINQIFLTSQIQVSTNPSYIMDGFDHTFYAFSMLTSLGFSEAMPTTQLAKSLAMLEVLFGIGWFALFTSILINRVLK